MNIRSFGPIALSVLVTALAASPGFARGSKRKAPRPATGRQVAAIVVGPDAKDAGILQLRLDRMLKGSGSFQLVRSERVVALLTKEAASEFNQVLGGTPRAEADAILKSVQDRYYQEGAVADGLIKLEEASELYRQAGDQTALTTAELALWRAVLLGQQGNLEQAEVEARLALTHNPALKVDPDKFPPSIAALVAEVREQVKTHTVKMQGLPEGAVVRLDGLVVNPTFAAAPGSHKLEVTSPGYRPWRKKINVSKARTMRVAMAYNLGSELDTMLSSFVWNPAANLNPAASRQLLAELKADSMVVLGFQGEAVDTMQAAYVWSNGDITASDRMSMNKAGFAQLKSWLRDPGASKADDKIFRVGYVSTETEDVTRWLFQMEGGLTLASRNRTVAALEQSEPTQFFGVGPSAVLHVDRKAWLNQVSLDYLSYDGTTVAVAAGDVITNVDRKGSHLKVGAGSGYRYQPHPRVSVEGLGSFFIERHRVTGNISTTLDDFFAGYARYGIETRAGVGTSINEMVSLTGGFTFSPFNHWTQQGANEAATVTHPTMAFGFDAGVRVVMREMWTFALTFRQDSKGVGFVDSPPPLVRGDDVEVSVDETDRSLQFGVQTIF